MVNGVGFNSRQQSSKGEYANEGGWGGGGNCYKNSTDHYRRIPFPPPRLILKKNKATYIFASEQVFLQHVLQQCNLPGWIHKQGIYVCVSAWIHRGTL